MIRELPDCPDHQQNGTFKNNVGYAYEDQHDLGTSWKESATTMNVLLLNYEYPPVGGGGGYVSHNVAKTLVGRGHAVTVVTATYRNLPAKEDRDGVIIYRLPSLRKKMERTTSFEMLTYVILCYLFLMIFRMRGRRFDVAHIHFALPTGLLGPWVRLLFGINYLLTIHGTDLPGNDATRFKLSHEISRPFLIFSLGNAACITTVTPHLKELAYNVIQRDDIVIIPNGVNTELFYPRNLGRTNSLIFVGRLIPIKSPEFIVAAIPSIAHEIRGVKLRIGGDGYLREPLERMVRDKNIPDHVEFMKWIDHEKLPTFYSTGRVFISIQKHDNFGSLAMLEAMACGLPVIASMVGDTGKQVVNGQTGFTIKLDDHDEFVDKVSYLLTHPEECERMGQEASTMIRKNYSWENITTRYEELLRKISR